MEFVVQGACHELREIRVNVVGQRHFEEVSRSFDFHAERVSVVELPPAVQRRIRFDNYAPALIEEVLSVRSQCPGIDRLCAIQIGIVQKPGRDTQTQRFADHCVCDDETVILPQS